MLWPLGAKYICVLYNTKLVITVLQIHWLFPKRQNLDSSKQKEFADDNFEIDLKGGKFSKWLENTVEKGEIARYEQFLLFPQCFQKNCTANT